MISEKSDFNFNGRAFMRHGIRKIGKGIEITKSFVNAVTVGLSPEGLRLLKRKRVPLSDDVIRFSYRNENILKKELFIQAVREALDGEKECEVTIGVGLPNEIIKMSLQEFQELPKEASEIERMVAWTIERTFYFPAKSTKVSWHSVGKRKNGAEKMFVTACDFSVIREYEQVLKENHIYPKMMSPSGIAQFNFYCEKIPDQGVVAYLGLFETCFGFYVFNDGELSFYQGIRKGFSSRNYLDDIDMCFDFYMGKNPDQDVERLYIGGLVENREEMREVFTAFGNMEVTVLDEFSLIGKERALGMSRREELAGYAAAIGAARSVIK